MIRPEYLQTLFVPKKPGKNQPPPDWSQPFAILTAYNPGTSRPTEENNKEQNRLLRQQLSRERHPKHKVDAVSEDWSHTEKSFAVWRLDHATAAKIGRDFGQDVHFWVENDTVTVHSCTTPNPPTFQILGRWEDRIRTHDDRPARNIYVIQLDPSVLEKRAFKEKNPNYQSGKDCLYVGTSIYPPEERYAQHKSGENASSYVKNYGLKLQPELYQNQPILTAYNYDEEERAYAEELRRLGHAVWQN